MFESDVVLNAINEELVLVSSYVDSKRDSHVARMPATSLYTTTNKFYTLLSMPRAAWR